MNVVQEKLQKDLEAVEAVDSELKEVLDAQAKEVHITALDFVKRMGGLRWSKSVIVALTYGWLCLYHCLVVQVMEINARYLKKKEPLWEKRQQLIENIPEFWFRVVSRVKL